MARPADIRMRNQYPFFRFSPVFVSVLPDENQASVFAIRPAQTSGYA